MTQNYLPNRASIPEACEWMKEQTGEPWTLARLLEYGLMPWFWLEYQPGWPDALFGGRAEGYLAPLCFQGDINRLAADGRDVLVTMTRTHDGVLMKVGPPAWHFPIDELRFLRDDITRLSGTLSKQSAPVKLSLKPVLRSVAQEAAIIEEIERRGIDPLAFPNNPRGKGDMKAAIREKLLKSHKQLFQSARVFNTAWQRLRDQKRIVDRTA